MGLSAQILGPPIDPSLVAQMTYKNQHFGAAESSDDEQVVPFAKEFFVKAKALPKEVFKFYDSDAITRMINDAQPDVLRGQGSGC